MSLIQTSMITFIRTNFGRLRVKGYVRSDSQGRSYWKCDCTCGSRVLVRSDNLTSGNTKSCGCLQREVARSAVKHGQRRIGQRGSPTYNSWRGMKMRCLNPHYHQYKYYGGRGITVTLRWLGEHGFEKFLLDMGVRPKRKTLDRKDNEGNYTPNNCKWSTPSQQRRNQRSKEAK